MRFILLNLAILTVMGLSVQAEEHGGGGEGEGNAAGKELTKDQKDYIEKSGRLNSLANRIVEHNKHFNEVVHKKAAAHSAEEKQQYISVLNQISKDRDKDVETFNRLKQELKLRYPDKGEVLERRYHTQTKKSAEEMESVAGLDELLTRTKKILDKKYRTAEPEGDEARVTRPASVDEADEKPKRLKLER
ncbi:MAG: hypothetical protein AB7F86_04870 [Bdellovibrionales bacterium]